MLGVGCAQQREKICRHVQVFNASRALMIQRGNPDQISRCGGDQARMGELDAASGCRASPISVSHLSTIADQLYSCSTNVLPRRPNSSRRSGAEANLRIASESDLGFSGSTTTPQSLDRISS